MKKVLIITFYWPPSGGSGVRRWLSFSNLLHAHNWEPIIFRPINANYPSIDPKLKNDIHPNTKIIGSKIFEPFDFYSKFIGGKKNINPGTLHSSNTPSFKENIAVWIRSNIFIPDARMFWIFSGVKTLKKYLKEHPVDLIISTGPPHTTHIIAKKIANKFQIPWIADFRDPWTNIDFFHKLNLNKRALRKHKKLEKEVLSQSDMQTTVSWSWAEDFKKLGAKNIQVITNGFDPSSIRETSTLDRKFTITHLGSMNEDRNHPVFWQALAELIHENNEFRKNLRIQLFGSIVDEVKKDLTAAGLNDYCEHIPFVSHDEAMEVIARSRVLYLPLNNTPNVAGIVPGKIFEYLAVRRPIFAIGPTSGDSAQILRIAENEIINNFDDYTGIKKSVQTLFSNYLNKTDIIDSNNYLKFSRHELIKEMVKLMNETSKQNKNIKNG